MNKYPFLFGFIYTRTEPLELNMYPIYTIEGTSFQIHIAIHITWCERDIIHSWEDPNVLVIKSEKIRKLKKQWVANIGLNILRWFVRSVS